MIWDRALAPYWNLSTLFIKNLKLYFNFWLCFVFKDKWVTYVFLFQSVLVSFSHGIFLKCTIRLELFKNYEVEIQYMFLFKRFLFLSVHDNFPNTWQKEHNILKILLVKFAASPLTRRDVSCLNHTTGSGIRGLLWSPWLTALTAFRPLTRRSIQRVKTPNCWRMAIATKNGSKLIQAILNGHPTVVGSRTGSR